MRVLALKQRSKYNDKDVLSQILLAPSREGAQIEFMRFAFKVLDKLEVATDKLVLEENEYKRLLEKIQTFPFVQPHRDFLALAQDLETCEETKALKLVSRGGESE
jgi:hypothetical protein